jgi:peptidoglycan/xylan/chitin deacetylase (PgdA/CDA1 family)
MSNNGVFVISLDFELYWGMFDKVTLDEYGENIKGVHMAIPEMLTLFAQNNIHATWATVGMLMAHNEQELHQLVPRETKQPVYKDMRVSAYEYVQTHTPLQNIYHFAPELVTKIIATPNQELGSHTFSHYYCIDGNSNNKDIFAADCEAFKHISSKFGIPVTSIVFPRNQASPEALEALEQFGFTAYRGTPSHFLYTGKKEQNQTNILLRALRLLDTYINLSGHHTYPIPSATKQCVRKEKTLLNIPGSWFLRPYSKTLATFEWLKIRRIKNAMTYAAKHGEIYHLWWHPHNFGINRKQNMKNLLEIIEHFKRLQEQYGMESANMLGLVNRTYGLHSRTDDLF